MASGTNKRTLPVYSTGLGAINLGNVTGTQVQNYRDFLGTANQAYTGQTNTGMANPETAASEKAEKITAANGRTATTAAPTVSRPEADETYKAGVGTMLGKSKATGTGAGGTTVDPQAAQYAQYIAETYARTQPGNAPAWNDQWAPQIEALQGQRYGPYESKYLPMVDNLLDRILNRGDFQYNWSDDPLYRQYAARYQQQARQGMQDTMGQAAALTGGYGSSYATAAGNQAYAQQMQGLNDRAMELYQLAKDRWDTAGTEMRSNLAALENREASNRAYYQDDRDTFYGRNDADIANLRDSQAMGWAAYQDAADREMAERQMAWDQYQYWNNLYESLRNKGGSGGSGGGSASAKANVDAGAYADRLAAIKAEAEDWRKKQKKGFGSNPSRNNRVNMQE